MLVGVAQLAAAAARLLGAPPRDDGPSSLVEAEHPRARRALAAWLREAQERLKRVTSLLQVEDALAIMHGSSHVRQLAGITWRTAMLASLLGARDALDEVEGREPIATPDRFEAFSGALELDVDRKVGTHTDPIKPFWEALDKFAGRSPANKHEWNMMVAAERERAFTAAVATSREMVGQIQTVVFDALANGKDLKWFRRELKAKVVDIADHQANVILRNAQATSYAQGRMVTMTAPHVVLARPYWQVLTADDGPPRQRPTHRAIHGWVMRADDPGWQKTNPPHGHNCRCRLVARSKAWVEKNAPTLWSGPFPNLPDPGWTCVAPPPVELPDVL